MNVHVLVEGKSEKAFFDGWAHRAFKGHTFVAHPHQGKGSLPTGSANPNPKQRGLLDLLPATLRAYNASTKVTGDAVLVLVDADEEDCAALKDALVALVRKHAPDLNVVIRIAVEETEAFYLGDLRALKAAFPKANLNRARRYHNDEIVGTAELFGEIVGDGGLNKVQWAELMASRLTTRAGESRSPSFKALIAGIAKLVTKTRPEKRRAKKHWKARHPGFRK